MSPEEYLSIYSQFGFRLLTWERKGPDPKEWKGPHGLEAKGWNDPNRVYDLSAYDPERMNLGTFTGHEIRPGKFLVDLDLDWAPGILLARRLLPPTGFGFRRKGKNLSHVMYTTPERLDIETYCDITDDGTDGNGQTFLEVRGGNSSRQTMVAPSKHSEGVFIEFVDHTDIAHVETRVLKERSVDYAIGCLLLRRLPGGLHHEGRIYLSGFLLKHGFVGARVINLLEAICEAQFKAGVEDMSVGDIGDCTLVVGSTEQRMRNKDARVAGGPKFAEWIGSRGKDVVNRMRKWLGASAQADGLILNPNDPDTSAHIFIEHHYTLDNVRSLQVHNEIFYQFEPPSYRQVERPVLKAEIWRFLASAYSWTVGKEPTLAPFQPNIMKLNNVLEGLKSITTLDTPQAPPCWLDSDPGIPPLNLIACKNGLIDVTTRAILPLTPSFFNINGLNFDYSPNLPPPNAWLKFLDDLWNDDPEVIDILQEIFGYLLTPDTSFQKMFLMIGPKRSGKSLIGRILTKLIGERNASAPTLTSFGREFGKQQLIGKTVAIVADARISGRTDTALIAETLLAISGEDYQSIERKFLESWHGKLSTRFLIITNEIPKISEMSGALVGRFILLVLTKSFWGKEDHGLYTRLEPELPSILNWALEGRERLYKRGYFVQPKSSEQMLQEFSDLASPTLAFLNLATTYNPKSQSEIEGGDLFRLWQGWCADNGMEHPGTAQTFAKSVRAAFPGIDIKIRGLAGHQRRHWVGLRLTDEWAERLSSEGNKSGGGGLPLDDM